MTRIEAQAKVNALLFAWGWLTYLSEGYEEGRLSDNLLHDVDDGRMTEEEATLTQKMANHEADIIHRKMWKLRSKYNLPNSTTR